MHALFVSFILFKRIVCWMMIRHQGQTCKIAHFTCHRSTVWQQQKSQDGKKGPLKRNNKRFLKPNSFFNRDFWSVKVFLYGFCFSFYFSSSSQNIHAYSSIIVLTFQLYILVRTCFFSECFCCCQPNSILRPMKLHFISSLALWQK